MSRKLLFSQFNPRKFMFVKNFKLRVYITFSVILIFGLYLDNSKFTLKVVIILFLLSFIFFIHGRRAGALSYAGVIYTRSLFKYERDNRMIAVKVRSLDLLNYIKEKSNQNILICGTSGQGKSRLMRYLLYLSSENKVIFSYKENDDYLKMGYNVLDVKTEMPDPFKDKEAFVNAFLITYPIQNMGIISQYIPIFLRDMAKISLDWNDFLSNLNIKLKSSKDQIQRSAYLFIIEHSKSLIGSNYKKDIMIGEEDIVLDFSRVNESSKTFYSELILRILWKELTQNRKKIIICIDEAHRLLYNFERYQSIYIEMSREIRAFGKLWTSTQNFSDIPSYVRNQFATQFVFNSAIKDDLNEFMSIDQKLRWAVANMPRHCFTDARYPWIYKVIPEFLIYWYPLDVDNAKTVISTLNYGNEIVKILRDNVYDISTLIEIISKNYGLDANTVKINVKNSINALVKGKAIHEVLYNSNKLYFGRTLDSSNLSLFHKFLENKVVDILTELGIKINIIANKGQELPDIATSQFNIEIETGLKHDLTDLKKRISQGDKHNIIVVPDSTVLNKYKLLKNSEVIQINELKEFLKKNYN